MPAGLMSLPPATLLKLLALALGSGLAVYALNRLGALSLLYGSGIALLVALPARLASAYAGALLAHASGQCGARDILAADDAGAARGAALGALALLAAAWGGALLGGRVRSRARYPLLARLACAAALAGMAAAGELGAVPPAELLANYWTLQRLAPWGAAALLADTQRGWRRLLFPALAPAEAWAAEHARCFAVFSGAAAAATAALAAVLAAGAWAGPGLCCGSGSSRGAGAEGGAGAAAAQAAPKEAARAAAAQKAPKKAAEEAPRQAAAVAPSAKED